MASPETIEARRAVIAVAVGIVALGVLGSVDLFLVGLPGLSLDGERTVPAVFTSGLLLAAGLLAWRVPASGDSSDLWHPRLWRLIGAFFVFMALDELLAIHERLSEPVTGVSWHFFYAPLVLLAAVGWFGILRRLPSRRQQVVWSGGAAAWFVAQVIEAVQWDSNRLVHAWTVIPEEMLEMTGSLMWALVGLLALQQAAGEADRAEGERMSRTASEPRSRGAGRRGSRVREADRSSAGTGRTPSVR